MSKLQLVEYSDKAVAIFGNTYPLRDDLKQLGGKFNPSLTHPEYKLRCAGWIFAKSKLDEIRNKLGLQVADGCAPVKIEQPVISAPEPITKAKTAPPPKTRAITKQTLKETIKKPVFKPVQVTVSGFCEMVRTFTKESEMMKFCKDLKKTYEDRVCKSPVNYGDLYHAGGYNTKDLGFWDMFKDNQKTLKKAGIEPLKIEFKQL